MKDRINRLARGIVDLDVPSLQLSRTSFAWAVTAGELSKGELVLSSGNRIHLKGLMYSDHPRVRVLKPAFGGVKTRITFEIDARDCADTDQIKGSFFLVSNAGELTLPFSFEVRGYASAQLLSSLKTPQELARLFMDDEELALRVFGYADFPRAPFMDSPQVRTIYEGLKNAADQRGALLEFLRALKVAPRVEMVSLGAGRKGEKAVQSNAGRAGQPGRGVLADGGSAAEDGAPYPEQELRPLRGLHPELLEDAPLVAELATAFIRAGLTSPDVFAIYARAVEQDAKITRLYDYYLYALPEDFTGRMPRAVYLYFSYENSVNPNLKLPLYCNILQNYPQDSDIYQKYEREIQDYAIENLLRANISDKLALIYDRMIYPDMVDARIASVLPAILKSYCVRTRDRRMTSVVVRYEELSTEDVYPLKNGTAYVPIFFDNSVILFQDAFGRRYVQLPYSRTPVMDKPLLEQRCFALCPDHPMLKLAAVRRIVAEGIQNGEQLALVEETAQTVALNAAYRRRLQHAVLAYHDRSTQHADMLSAQDRDFLRQIDRAGLSAQDRGILIRTLVRTGAFSEAYRTAVQYGAQELDRTCTERLLKHEIAREGSGEDGNLLSLSLALFDAGSRDRELLGYLCACYNGLSADMLRILKRSVEQKADTADLAERLLAQMIFTREESGMDYVFHAYMLQEQRDRVLVSAYVTQKCIDYFIGQRPVSEAVFAELGRMVSGAKDKARVPVIHLLTLTRYFAEQKSLNKNETALLKEILPLLLEQKLVFAYTKKLARFAELPAWVTDRSYIEYHGERDARPVLQLRILPDEQAFQEEEFPRVYQNIYVKALMLFAGERAEYRVFGAEGPAEKPLAQGQVSVPADSVPAKDGTCALLNEMSALSGQNSPEAERRLRESMLRYARMQSMIDALFGGEAEHAAENETERRELPQ